MIIYAIIISTKQMEYFRMKHINGIICLKVYVL